MDYKEVDIDSNGVGLKYILIELISYEFEIFKINFKMCIIVLKT